MRARYAALAVFLIALGATHVASAAVDSPTQITLSYEIALDGLRVASVGASATYDGAKFVVEAKTRTRGLLDTLVGFRSTAETTAILDEGSAVPISHDVDNIWRGKSRYVHLRYDKGAIATVDIYPSAADEDRDPVPDEERSDTVDPVTASLRMMLAAREGAGCLDHLQVFDGRRRYDFHCIDEVGGSVKLGDPPWLHNYTFRQIRGRQRHPFWSASKYPKKLTVWFAQPDDRLPPLIVRIASKAGIANLAIRLAGLTIDGQEVATGASGP